MATGERQEHIVEAGLPNGEGIWFQAFPVERAQRLDQDVCASFGRDPELDALSLDATADPLRQELLRVLSPALAAELHLDHGAPQLSLQAFRRAVRDHMA